MTMLAAEKVTERLARTVACPVCGVHPDQWCRVIDSWRRPTNQASAFSHTGRLLLAKARRR